MNIVTVAPEASLREAARRMRDEHVGDVLVVQRQDPADQPVPLGILTDRDIVLSTVALGIDPSIVSVEDVMTPAPVTARSSDSLSQVLRKMSEAGVNRIPLVDERGQVETLLSSQDVLERIADDLKRLVGIRERQRELESQRRRKVA